MPRLYSQRENVIAHNIEPEARLTLIGQGNKTLNGDIGENATIIKNARGNLYINGTVGEHVTFILYGRGDIYFMRPNPQSVRVNCRNGRIWARAVSHIRRNPNLASRQIARDRHNDADTVLLDNVSSTTNTMSLQFFYHGFHFLEEMLNGIISRLMNREPNPRVLPRNQLTQRPVAGGTFFADNVPSGSGDIACLTRYTNITQTYLEHFNNKEPYSTIVESLALNSDIKARLFAGFIDPLSMDVINIPVRLNGNLFCCNGLFAIPVAVDGTRKDPLNREPFYLRDIQPARDINEAIKKAIEDAREAQMTLTRRPRCV